MYQLIIAHSSHDGDYAAGLEVTFHVTLEQACQVIVDTGKALLMAGDATPQAFLDAAAQAVAGGLKTSVDFLHDCEEARSIITDLNSLEEVEDVENPAVAEAAQAAVDAGVLAQDDQSWLTDYIVQVYEVRRSGGLVNY
jgi:hypothetical protein